MNEQTKDTTRATNTTSIDDVLAAEPKPKARPRMTADEMVKHITTHGASVTWAEGQRGSATPAGVAISGAGVTVETPFIQGRIQTLEAGLAAHRAAVESLVASRR